MSPPLAAAAGPGISSADTAWMLMACALVLLMTPALAFFYGGLVRSKNALNTMMRSFASLGAAFIASRATRNADLRTLPLTTVIGFAAALVQLIR